MKEKNEKYEKEKVPVVGGREGGVGVSLRRIKANPEGHAMSIVLILILYLSLGVDLEELSRRTETWRIEGWARWSNLSPHWRRPDCRPRTVKGIAVGGEGCARPVGTPVSTRSSRAVDEPVR